MPTFRNNTDKAIMYRGTIRPPDSKLQEIIIIVDAGKDVALNFWIPYEKLGLELVNENYPPVPNTLLLSGLFKFNEGTERKFSIEACDTYTVDVIVQKGALKLYAGNSAAGAEILADVGTPYHYSAEYEWEYAPYIRAVGLQDNTEASIHAEINLRRR